MASLVRFAAHVELVVIDDDHAAGTTRTTKRPVDATERTADVHATERTVDVYATATAAKSQPESDVVRREGRAQSGRRTRR